MTIIGTAIKSLEEVNFDRLYQASAPFLDQGNIKWPKGSSADARKEIYRKYLIDIFASSHGLACAITVGSEHHAIIAGFKQGGAFEIGALLAEPINDSRSYLYTETVWNQFFRDNGIDQIIVTMAIGSSIPALMRGRYPNARSAQLIDGQWRQSVHIPQEPK